ncbi:1,5-anhydro-D-fructose reductase (1,5-anhydro-D-mannitol-forming) [Paraburkholderia sp. GAS448]|uniref:Gfo/Idh/MocA family protein n=1 Tax=Paraburkholderia sp. GAS448 TaxID=3035136 RepID=UPI003D1A00FF
MPTKIRWALVGASTIADEWMVNAIRTQPDGTIEAVVSGSAERAREFADKHGIARLSTNLDEILADRDIVAVYISSTNEKHLPQVLAAAAAGKHVLCEKPLALSETDASQMIEACAAHQVVLATNHHLRCAATHRRMRDLIRSGAVGTPLYVRVFHAVSLPPHLRGWRIERPDAGGGVIFDISVHDADTLRFLLDAEPVEVSAMTSSGSMGSAGLADGVMGIIRFSNGVLAQIHDAFNVPYASTGLEIHGTEGSLIARDVMTQRPVGAIELRSAKGLEIVEVVHQDLYITAVAQFHRAVVLGEDPAATGPDGYRSLATALALQESASTGAHVTVSPQFTR